MAAITKAKRAGPATTNSLIETVTAPKADDIARENRRTYEPKTPAHTLGRIPFALMALSAVRDDKMLAQLPNQHNVHPNQIGDLNDQLLTRATNVRCANDVLQFESR